MDLTKILKITGELPNKIQGSLKAFTSALTGKIRPLVGELLGNFSGKKQRLLLFALAGVAVLFLVLLVSALALRSRRSTESVPSDISSGPRITIPPEELFLPAQPDSLPEYLLEREPRGFWSIEDIRPYWRNPAAPDIWQDEIKSAVDKLMEAVP